jgi:hypothetical protein
MTSNRGSVTASRVIAERSLQAAMAHFNNAVSNVTDWPQLYLEICEHIPNDLTEINIRASEITTCIVNVMNEKNIMKSSQEKIKHFAEISLSSGYTYLRQGLDKAKVCLISTKRLIS